MNAMRCKTKYIQKLSFVLLLVISTSASAVGPDSPIRFDADESKDPWTLVIISDARLVKKLKIEVWLYQRNKILQKRNVAVSNKLFKKSEREDIYRANLSLKPDDLAKLEPGFYSQKVVIQANRSTDKNSKPFRIQRWGYLEVGKAGVRPLTMKQYSAITDPSVIDADHFGREVTVSVGFGEKLEKTLDKTKGTAAMPVGRLGGLKQEQPPKRQKQKEEEEEEDEQHED